MHESQGSLFGPTGHAARQAGAKTGGGIECPRCGAGTRVLDVVDHAEHTARVRRCTSRDCSLIFHTRETSREGGRPTGRRCPVCASATWATRTYNLTSVIRRERTCRDDHCGHTFKTKEVIEE